MLQLALLLAGCGSGPRSSNGATSMNVTRGQLALMVLPKWTLGPQTAGLKVDRASGFLTNGQRAAADPDPRVTTASLSKGGRLGGYALQYSLSESQGEQAIGRRAGLLKIGTDVDLYRDKAAAVVHSSSSVNDLVALVGKPIRDGATLERGTTFSLRGIGDAAVGMTLTVRIQGVRIYFTEVDFRIGRLLASAVVARADPKNVNAQAIDLAHGLEKRIENVLSGKIRG